jgi:hypothetical protein
MFSGRNHAGLQTGVSTLVFILLGTEREKNCSFFYLLLDQLG